MIGAPPWTLNGRLASAGGLARLDGTTPFEAAAAKAPPEGSDLLPDGEKNALFVPPRVR
jgi:hypothetical protein